jgi:hypothetical protein
MCPNIETGRTDRNGFWGRKQINLIWKHVQWRAIVYRRNHRINLGCDAVLPDRNLPTFQRNVLPPSKSWGGGGTNGALNFPFFSLYLWQFPYVIFAILFLSFYPQHWPPVHAGHLLQHLHIHNIIHTISLPHFFVLLMPGHNLPLFLWHTFLRSYSL